MTHPIPREALAQSVAIVGRTGSGKSYTARGAVELLLVDGARVCIIDPTGVWHGLRSSADGQSAGFSVVVFGGDHGDVAIADTSGAALAELIATRNLPAVVDLSEFSRAGMTRFMGPFLETLYGKTNRQPLTLVVDEADLFAPQRVEPDTAKMLGRMEQIVRRGRVRGFRPWLITQRPASLNKNVLSQAATLIAMQLTAPQDRDAIGAWIEGQADRDEGKKLLAALPKLQRGEGFVWSPGNDRLERVHFPRIRTFDSSRTPEEGETLSPTALADVDLSGIAESLAAVEEGAARDDPKELRKRIAELEAIKPGVHPVDVFALEIEKQNAFRKGVLHALSLLNLPQMLASIQGGIDHVDGAMALIEQAAQQAQRDADAPHDSNSSRSRDLQRETAKRAKSIPVPFRTSATTSGQIEKAGTNGSETDVSLTPAERAILTAVAQRHPKLSSRQQIALLSGRSITSSAFGLTLASLRRKGLLEGEGDRNAITSSGIGAIGGIDPAPTGAALIGLWRGRLREQERAFFDAITGAYPDAISKEELSKRTGYSLTSSSFGIALGKLRSLELIARGELKASPDLFG